MGDGAEIGVQTKDSKKVTLGFSHLQESVISRDIGAIRVESESNVKLIRVSTGSGRTPTSSMHKDRRAWDFKHLEH